MNNYVAYHVHDDNSLLDSCTKYTAYIDKAAELGQTAIAITNHGNIYNWLERKLYAEKKGIKMLLGMECYLTEDECVEGCEKHRDNYHTILIAKNPLGEKELCRLFDTSSKPNHKYYNNRISMDEFFSISDNIYKISACLASPLNALRKRPEKIELVVKLIKAYDYLEIQPHLVEEQIEYNSWLYNMSVLYDKPLIAGTDTHSLDTYKAECRKILKTAKKIQYDNEDSFDLTYKSYDELCDMFRKQNAIPEKAWLSAIDNTNIMADSVTLSETDRSLKYPKLYGDNDIVVLRERIKKMYEDKVQRGVIVDSKEYTDRINEELEVFQKVNYVGFMLFMSEMAEWCWQNNIPIGYCRGSVGGSLIAYIIDIIDVNPIRWKTVFSRFCNVTRAATETGDIDIDISPSQRHLVQQYIINRFGNDYTGRVLSIGTISDKGTIDDIGRALALEHKDKLNNPYSLDKVAKIKSEYESNPEKARLDYKELFYYFDGLVGTNVSQSMHSAGVIASPISLTDNYGSFWNEGRHILAINMEECHELQLAKYDCLGLKNIEIIKDCCKYAGIPYPKSHSMNWEDKDVWEHIIDSPVGIFQFEGAYAFDLLKKYKPTMITHLSTINASLRPSGASYRNDLISHKKCVNPSTIIDELLKDNEGYLIFQEDTIKFLQEICGLSGDEADNVRRAIGRKQTDRLQAALPQILEGYCQKSPQPREVAEKEAQQFLQIIEDSSNYQFGYNHSTGYSMIGYTCAWLRYYYPVEFVCAYLKNANGEEDITNGMALAKLLNVKIPAIKFRYSGVGYIPDVNSKSVYKGLSSLKYMNDDVAEKLYSLRDVKFESFIDFLKVNPADTRQTSALIQLDFFSEFGGSKKLLAIHDLFQNYYSKKEGVYVSKKQIKKGNTDIPIELLNKYAISESPTLYKFDSKSLDKLLEELSNSITDEDINISEKIAAQQEYLGYICATEKEEDRRNLYIRQVYPCERKSDGKVWAYNILTTSIGSGKESSLTVYKAAYNQCKIRKGDIIYAESISSKEFKCKKYWYLIKYKKIFDSLLTNGE